jgi:hypothetical protein
MDKGVWEKYPLAKILCQDTEVLGTDQRKHTVTLAVTPQEAVDLTWAAQAGRISLVLPGSGDKTPVKNIKEAETFQEGMGQTKAALAGHISMVLPGSGDKTSVKNKEEVKPLRADAGRLLGTRVPPPRGIEELMLIRGIEYGREPVLDNKNISDFAIKR